MIPVTKPYLPSREKLNAYIDGIYERSWLTNNGPLVQELTVRLERFLGVENLLLVSNGTLALQVAYRALGVSSINPDPPAEVITTPFSFVATASSLRWEGLAPIFADIDPRTWCLDPVRIEAAITPATRAIVPVHVFGNACDVETIDALAAQHDLKVIYDAAHAFGVDYKGQSLLAYGDAATLSFHATKLFHTVEGGAIVFKHKADLQRASEMINFGLAGPNCIESLGINAKMNEFQAAMGLCVLDEMEGNSSRRRDVFEHYCKSLRAGIRMPDLNPYTTRNYAYFPLLLEDQKTLMEVVDALSKQGVQSRRYFYPSLDTIALLGSGPCEISRNIAGRVLCLPIYADLSRSEVSRISAVVNEPGNFL